MKKLVFAMILLMQPAAHANKALADKMYQDHFDKVKITLAVIYRTQYKDIKPDTLFNNVDGNGNLIGINDYSMTLALVSYEFAQMSFDPKKVKSELLRMEPREGCEIQYQDGKSIFQFDAECISRALYYSTMSRV